MCSPRKSDENFSILTFLWIKTNVAYTRLEVIAKQRSALQVDDHRRQTDLLLCTILLLPPLSSHMAVGKRRYRVCPIIHCCNNTTPYWITAPPILFYMVPCKEGHLCACNILGKHQPLVKRNISFESYEWALFIKVTLFTNGSGCPGTIVLWRCQKVMRTN